VSLRPPSSWAKQNNAYRTYYGIRLEPLGTRRFRTYNNLDVRLEKEFLISGTMRLGLYVDVWNILGFSGVTIGMNDLRRWNPKAEGFGKDGTATLDPYYQYISGVSGRRTFNLSLRLSF
jgi:hypothetical protein